MQGWEHIGTFGRTFQMYSKGEQRRIIDQKGHVVVEYDMRT
jgi:hypothetical protein